MSKGIIREFNVRFFNILTCLISNSLLITSLSRSIQGTKLIDIDLNNKTRLCLRVAENNVYKVTFEPKEDHCEGWICWQSQLKLSNKMKILRIMNNFRNSLADNISNMHKVSWHWTLEQEAIRASGTCKRRFLEEYPELRNIDGLGSNLHCENACLRKMMTQNPSQTFFVQVLMKLLKNNSLDDFDSNGKFRRANAMYFGCSLVIRSTISEEGIYGDLYHFVCVFCTKDSEMKTIYKTEPNDTKCDPLAVLGSDPRYPALCAVLGRHSIHICPPFELCPHDEHNKPRTWQIKDPGTAIEFVMLETLTGPQLLVTKEEIGSYTYENTLGKLKAITHFDSSGKYLKILNYYPPLPKYVYDFNPKHLRKYAYAVSKLTNGTVQVISPTLTEPCVIHEPADAVEGTKDAWCCTSLLVMSCIPTFVLAALITYTIRNR